MTCCWIGRRFDICWSKVLLLGGFRVVTGVLSDLDTVVALSI
jgi:hypothetical protein